MVGAGLVGWRSARGRHGGFSDDRDSDDYSRRWGGAVGGGDSERRVQSGRDGRESGAWSREGRMEWRSGARRSRRGRAGRDGREFGTRREKGSSDWGATGGRGGIAFHLADGVLRGRGSDGDRNSDGEGDRTGRGPAATASARGQAAASATPTAATTATATAGERGLSAETRAAIRPSSSKVR